MAADKNKHADKENGNGRDISDVVRLAGAAKGNSNSKEPNLQLSDMEVAILRQKEQRLNGLKLVLANAQLEVWNAEQRRAAVTSEVVTANNDFNNTIGEWAKARGIDPSDPKQGRWNFDTTTMQFTRLN